MVIEAEYKNHWNRSRFDCNVFGRQPKCIAFTAFAKYRCGRLRKGWLDESQCLPIFTGPKIS